MVRNEEDLSPPLRTQDGQEGLKRAAYAFDDFLVPLADYRGSGQGTVFAATLQDVLSNKRPRTEAVGVGTDAVAGPVGAVSVTHPEINPKNAGPA